MASWLLRRPSTGGKLQRFDSADYFKKKRQTSSKAANARKQGIKQRDYSQKGINSTLVFDTQRWLERNAPGLRKSKRRGDIALRITELSKINVRPSAAEVLDLFSEDERSEIRQSVPEDQLDALCEKLAQRFRQACNLEANVKSSAATSQKANNKAVRLGQVA